MVIKNWKVRPFVVLLKKHEKLCFRFRFVFFFYLVFVFPSFWWSGGGYGSATVTGRFIFLVKTPQWHWIALMSKLFFVFFLFFCRSSLFVCFFKIDPEHSHETVFFSFNFFDHRFRFEALELIDMHNNDFQSWRGIKIKLVFFCCSKDETRGAFFLL